MIGSKPPWWMPIPLCNKGSINAIDGNCWSSSDKELIALLYIFFILYFSLSSLKSQPLRAVAYCSQSLLEKLKTMQGSSFLSTMRVTIFLIS